MSCPISREQLYHVLDELKIVNIEDNGLTFIINTAVEVTGKQIINTLFKANIEIKYFRNISKSTRPFFRKEQ